MDNILIARDGYIYTNGEYNKIIEEQENIECQEY